MQKEPLKIQDASPQRRQENVPAKDVFQAAKQIVDMIRDTNTKMVIESEGRIKATTNSDGQRLTIEILDVGGVGMSTTTAFASGTSRAEKVRAAKMLRQRGYKQKEIADMIDASQSSVCNYLKE